MTAASRLGLVARLPPGLTFLLPGAPVFNLIFLRLPSLMSPPDPAPSPSLPEPAPRGRFSSFPRVAVVFFFKLAVPLERPAFVSELMAGEREREGPFGVLTPEARPDDVPCFFFCLFCADSFPLASERSWDPERFSVLEVALRWGSCFLRPDGVLVPFVEAPEPGKVPFFFSSASFWFSSSLRRSSSESSLSLCKELVR